MLDSETRKFIQIEIQRALDIILTASTGSTPNVEQETIRDLYPGMDQTQARPVMHPYGIASKAPTGTLNVVAKSGSHVGNRMVIGHRDKNRPGDLSEGESVLYSSGGMKVYTRNGKIQIASENSDNPLVLGNELKDLLSQVLQLIADHTHVGNLGAETSEPINSGDFLVLKASPVDDGVILSDKVFTEK